MTTNPAEARYIQNLVARQAAAGGALIGGARKSLGSRHCATYKLDKNMDIRCGKFSPGPATHLSKMSLRDQAVVLMAQAAAQKAERKAAREVKKALAAYPPVPTFPPPPIPVERKPGLSDKDIEEMLGIGYGAALIGGARKVKGLRHCLASAIGPKGKKRCSSYGPGPASMSGAKGGFNPLLLAGIAAPVVSKLLGLGMSGGRRRALASPARSAGAVRGAAHNPYIAFLKWYSATHGIRYHDAMLAARAAGGWRMLAATSGYSG